MSLHPFCWALNSESCGNIVNVLFLWKEKQWRSSYTTLVQLYIFIYFLPVLISSGVRTQWHRAQEQCAGYECYDAFFKIPINPNLQLSGLGFPRTTHFEVCTQIHIRTLNVLKYFHFSRAHFPHGALRSKVMYFCSLLLALGNLPCLHLLYICQRPLSCWRRRAQRLSQSSSFHWITYIFCRCLKLSSLAAAGEESILHQACVEAACEQQRVGWVSASSSSIKLCLYKLSGDTRRVSYTVVQWKLIIVSELCFGHSGTCLCMYVTAECMFSCTGVFRPFTLLVFTLFNYQSSINLLTQMEKDATREANFK